MTEHSPSEHNIESLAERAKQMLVRLRVSIDELDETSSEHSASDVLDEVDEVEKDEVDTSDLDRSDDEPEDGPRIGYIDASSLDEASTTLVVDDPGATVEGESSDDTGQDPGSDADADDAVIPAVRASTDVAVSSEGNDLRGNGDDDDDDDDDNNRRKLGYLLPLLLIGLLAILLLVFWGDIFGSSADDNGSDGQEDSSDAVTTSTPEGSTTADTSETTDAPQTTSTTAPTTEAPPTTEPAPEIAQTAWELLGESSDTGQFASLGGPLGLQALLETQTDDDGNQVEFTLFAPSDDAISALTPAQLNTLATDPAAAEALVSYHFLDHRMTPELLVEAAGSQISSRVGLPIDVSLDGDDVILNGIARVSLDGLEAVNGNVLVIDTVLEPPTINEVIELDTIQFEVRSSDITPSGQEELQKAVEYFTENVDANALIEGHTDTDGPSEPNQRLSGRRANSVRDFLISQGVDGTRLTAEGFGESQPILIDGVEDKVASRRIEFKLR